MEVEQNSVTQTLITLLFTLKTKIFLKIFLMMLRNGLIHPTKIKMIKGRNKNVSGLFKDELGGKTMVEVVALRPKSYSYLDDDGSDHKKSKGTIKCVIKQKPMFENYKDCLFNNKAVYRSQERFKSYYHDVYTKS